MKKWSETAARILGLVSVAATLFIGVVTLADVVGRQINMPLFGAFELIQLAMIFLVFTALPAVTLNREHVTVDIAQLVFPARLNRILLLAVDLAGSGVCLFYAVQLWHRSAYLQRTAEVTSNLQIPIHPFVIVMAAMWLVTALTLLVMLADDLATLLGRREAE